MPALLPPPMPRFSCSTRRTSGNRSRTSSTVPSVEPWSTTIASCPPTLSRQRSIHGSELNATTTTETSDIRFWLMQGSSRHAAQVLPEHDGEARYRECDIDDEEEEAGGEGQVRADAEVAEEADE